MKAIRVLQTATVAMFIVMVLSGVVVLAFVPERIEAFGRLIEILFPIFLTEVIPALIGSPLTDAVRALAAKKEG